MKISVYPEGEALSELLEKAFAEAAKLPESEQDVLAKWILDELESERGWEEAFGRSQDALAKMEDRALKEHRAGKTQPLDPDQL